MNDVALAVWKDARDNHSKLWTLYIVVVSAILGFSFSNHFAEIATESKILVWCTWWVLFFFMGSNVYSLNNNLKALDAARAALNEIVKNFNEHNGSEISGKLSKAINSAPIDIKKVIVLHVVLDCLILLGIAARICDAT